MGEGTNVRTKLTSPSPSPSSLSGKKPARFKEELPKATKLLEQRTAPLELENNLGKTMIVNNPGGRGAGQPGFYVSSNAFLPFLFLSFFHRARLGSIPRHVTDLDYEGFECSATSVNEFPRTLSLTSII